MISERPIVFSTPMVQAILSGEKTQTRRIAKLNAAGRVARGGKNWHPDDPEATLACPYGQSEDSLWVRETWNGPFWNEDPYPANGYSPKYCKYKADGSKAPYYEDADGFIVERWRPSIHMPRWAARITLAITAVRLERLQDIGEEDAIAEGVERVCVGEGWRRYCDKDMELPGVPPCRTAVDGFRTLWELINGTDSWKINPWVWVVEFEKKERPK